MLAYLQLEPGSLDENGTSITNCRVAPSKILSLDGAMEMEMATTNHGDQRQTDYAFIDLFRALAAFWVLVAHCMIWGGWYWTPLPSAKIAVDLFMLISGFLMCATTGDLSRPDDRLAFWLRRYFRLAPLYYFTLLLVILGAPIFIQGGIALQELEPGKWGIGGPYDPRRIEYSWDNILIHLSFLFGLHPHYSNSTFLPDWSLSLEAQFYLAFPVLSLYLKSTRSLLLAGLLAAYVGSEVAVRIYFPEPSLLVFKLHYFIAGMLLFRSMKLEGNAKIGSVAAGLLLTCLSSVYGTEIIAGPMLYMAMLATALMENNTTTPASLDRIIRSKAVQFASNVSYGVYLLHGFAITAAGLALQGTSLPGIARVGVLLAFVVPTSYLGAYATYTLIERPGTRLGRRVIAVCRKLTLNGNATSRP